MPSQFLVPEASWHGSPLVLKSLTLQKTVAISKLLFWTGSWLVLISRKHTGVILDNAGLAGTKVGLELYSWCSRKLQCPYPSSAWLGRGPFLLPSALAQSSLSTILLNLVRKTKLGRIFVCIIINDLRTLVILPSWQHKGLHNTYFKNKSNAVTKVLPAIIFCMETKMVKEPWLELLEGLMKQTRQTNYSHKPLEPINHHPKS